MNIIYIKIQKNFWGGDTAPPQNLPPVGPSPHTPPPFGASILVSRPSVLKLCPQTEILVTPLGLTADVYRPILATRYGSSHLGGGLPCNSPARKNQFRLSIAAVPRVQASAGAHLVTWHQYGGATSGRRASDDVMGSNTATLHGGVFLCRFVRKTYRRISAQVEIIHWQYVVMHFNRITQNPTWRFILIFDIHICQPKQWFRSLILRFCWHKGLTHLLKC